MNYKFIFSINIILLLFVILFISCSQGNTSSGKFGTGNYKMILSDSTETLQYEGFIEIDAYKKGGNGYYKVSGIYYFDKISLKEDYGIGVMKGIFEGKTDSLQKNVTLNMNPKIADNNLYLNFAINSGVMKGTWSLETMKGTRAKGILEIKREE